ncbi:DUF2207 domain-containing protein [Luteolibacter algae]|uniref:DUF2207 domain-containing protein n=1 Tax=Luteolibacter algae TaxID=454151 RepID=A0ABW5D7N7_9BACT
MRNFLTPGVLILFFLTVFTLAAEERILSYDSEVKVGRDGWLDVTETIRVNVEGINISRGIYRDFPQNYVSRWGLRQRRPFKLQEVTRNGSHEPFRQEKMGSGLRIWIGSPDVILKPGTVHEYVLRYRTGRQLWFDEEGDELYWNVTGNHWAFPIDEVRASIFLPEGIRVRNATAYTGAKGETGQAYEKNEQGESVVFTTTKPFQIGEGLTVVARWAPGMLDASVYENDGFWKENLLLFLGMAVVLAGFGTFVYAWFLVGRDPAKGVIVPRWEPPAGFSPAVVRYIKFMRFDDPCFTAGVMSLASQGFLRIEGMPSEKFKLTAQTCPKSPLPDEAVLLDKLFSEGDELILDPKNHSIISSAKNQFHKALKKMTHGRFFKTHVKYWLLGMLPCVAGMMLMIVPAEEPGKVYLYSVWSVAFGFFLNSLAAKTRSGILSLRGMLTICLVIVTPIFGFVLWLISESGGVWCAVFQLTIIVMAILFHYLIKAPTPDGRKVLDEIDGFKEYLSVAEEDRLNLENPPEKTPELFERFLPYALALGVDQKWSEKFDEILSAASKVQGEHNYRPSFYSGNTNHLNNALTGAALGAAVGSALVSSAASPSSSGGSGGGSSGGGGGGGGGGGW